MKSTHVICLLLLGGLLVGCGVGTSPEQNTSNASITDVSNNKSDTKASQPAWGLSGKVIERQANLDEDRDPVIGEDDAPVTAYLYFDLTEGQYPRIRRGHIDQGELRVVFKDFTIDRSGQNAPAHLLANCVWKANNATVFEDYIIAVDEEYEMFRENRTDHLMNLAERYGVDPNRCLEKQSFSEDINEDHAGSPARGVPSMYLENEDGQSARLAGASNIKFALNETIQKLK